jgi:hypothetical protein
MSTLGDQDRFSARKEEIDWLEIVLKSEFFGVIKEFCGKSVAKYWLTGVLPAFHDGISPLAATQVISFDQQYQSLCGLTQENVDAIVTRTLRHFSQIERNIALNSLKFWYNGYKFNRASSGSEISTLYNPQLVFVHLQKMSKSYDDFLDGETTLFVENFFRQRPTRSLADTSEANLEMAIELLWF